MADVQVLIKVSNAAVPEAVPIAMQVGDLVRELLGESHTVECKVRILCQRCGDPMTLQDRMLTCESCLQDEEMDRRIAHLEEAGFYPGLEPLETLM